MKAIKQKKSPKISAQRRGQVMVNAKAEAGFSMIVHDKFGELGVAGRYSKELRLVEWGRYPPKFDIRAWDSADLEGKRMTKGVTFTLDELIKLRDILNKVNLEEYVIPEKKIVEEIV